MEALILDRHRMVGQLIGGVLAEVVGLEVLGICTTTAEACALIRQRPPRLLVLDVDLRGESYRDAVDLLRELNACAELLVITASVAELALPADLAPITIAVVDKADAWTALLAVLHRWWQNQPDCQCHSRLGCQQQLRAIDQLTPRELRLLLELGCGHHNKQIAANLALSPATVESYRKSVAAKLGVSGAQLVRLAVLYRFLRWHETQPANGC